MLKKDHRRRGVPSPGSPTQCVPVHFHHVVPAEHGVAFSPALWDASLFSHRMFVCARACRATLSRAFVISLFQGLQHGLAIEPHCGHLGWIQTGESTRIPPMQPPKAHLSDRAGLPSGLPRSPSLLRLSFLSYSFSRLTKCPWQNHDGSTVDSPSCPPPPLQPPATNYQPTWETSSFGASLRSCENVLRFACLQAKSWNLIASSNNSNCVYIRSERHRRTGAAVVHQNVAPL